MIIDIFIPRMYYNNQRRTTVECLSKRRSKVWCQRAVSYELYKGFTFSHNMAGQGTIEKNTLKLCESRAFSNLCGRRKRMDRRKIQQMWKQYDTILHIDEEAGVEFWYARELMILFGYERWGKF